MTTLGYRKSHCKNGHARVPSNLTAYGTCKECQKGYKSANWKNRDKEREHTRKFATYVSRKFGISVEEYNARLLLQDNKCALCGKEFYGNPKGLGSPALDHNHECGQLREFLHKKCNAALGLFDDCLQTCEKSVVYLKKHEVLKCAQTAAVN